MTRESCVVFYFPTFTLLYLYVGSREVPLLVGHSAFPPVSTEGVDHFHHFPSHEGVRAAYDLAILLYFLIIIVYTLCLVCYRLQGRIWLVGAALEQPVTPLEKMTPLTLALAKPYPPSP